MPQPFAVVVTDAGHNRLGNIPVTYTVIEGDGSFDGQTSLVVNTDPSGRAFATLTLGPEAGITNNVVLVDVAGNTGAPARFSASAQTSGDPAQTRVSGVVLDNTDIPIEGATVSLEGTGLPPVQTNVEGQFVIQPAPLGNVMLHVDGSTALRPGAWASLEFELVTIPGRDNTTGRPIYLLPLDVPNGLQVSKTVGGTITLPEIPGFSLTVEPGSATFPGGGQRGVISVTVVHADKVPMVPNFGQQPRLVVTIQPPGVIFDPPAQVTYPNLDGLAPGEITEFYSFDHDMGTFVAIGTGSVSEDGTVIQSDPGVGILKGGWQCAGNPQPTGQCQNAAVTITTAQSGGASPSTVGLKLGSSLVVQANGSPTSGGDKYTWSVQDLVGSDVVSLSVDSPSAATPNLVTVTGLKVGTVRVTVVFKPEDSDITPALDQIEIVVANVELTESDIRNNSIKVKLEHPTLQGQVALELIGIQPTEDHLMQTTAVRAAGEYEDEFVVSKLKRDRNYSGVRATWLLLAASGVPSVDDESPFLGISSIQVLGLYRHSVYNTPVSSDSSCSGPPETVYVTRNNLPNGLTDCSTFEPFTASGLWTAATNLQGHGILDFPGVGTVQRDVVCPAQSNAPGDAAGRTFRVQLVLPCENGVLNEETVAVGPGNLDLTCGNEVYIDVIERVKQVRDICPDCPNDLVAGAVD